MSTDPSISVVLIVKDEPDIDQTLSELRDQCLALNAECVVVDSSAGRLEYIAERHPWVRWIDFAQPPGVSFTIPQQRTEGVLAARSPLIAFCDSGGSPAPDWLSQMYHQLVDHPGMAVMGPLRSLRGDGMMEVESYLVDDTVIEHVTAANFAFARADGLAVGGFDPRFKYGSDVDFGWRLAANGTSTLFSVKPVMSMDWGDGTRWRRRAKNYGEAQARLFVYHPRNMLRELRLDVLGTFSVLWLPGLVISVLALPWLPWLLPLWVVLLAYPLLKNRQRHPVATLQRELLRVAAFWWNIPKIMFTSRGTHPPRPLRDR